MRLGRYSGLGGGGVMENTMCNSSTFTTPQSQVNNLMQEVADEAG